MLWFQQKACDGCAGLHQNIGFIPLHPFLSCFKQRKTLPALNAQSWERPGAGDGEAQKPNPKWFLQFMISRFSQSLSFDYYL